MGVSLDCFLRALTNVSGPAEAEGEQWWSLSLAIPFTVTNGMLVNWQALVSVIWLLIKFVWTDQTWPRVYLEAYRRGYMVGNSQTSLGESCS